MYVTIRNVYTSFNMIINECTNEFMLSLCILFLVKVEFYSNQHTNNIDANIKLITIIQFTL